MDAPALGWERVAHAFVTGEEDIAGSLRSVRSSSAATMLLLWGDLVFARFKSPKTVLVPEGLHDPDARALREIVWYQAEQAGLRVRMDPDGLLFSVEEGGL